MSVDWYSMVAQSLEAEGRHAAIEGALRQRLVQLVHEGRDVVLDYSFWSPDTQ